jgi:hypothetical protein
MSAGSASGIGPVSVRYAAQIRELLYSQAVQRLQAERERARAAAQAEKHERMQPKHKAHEDTQAQFKADQEAETKASDANAAPLQPSTDDAQVSANANASSNPAATAQLIDIQA